MDSSRACSVVGLGYVGLPLALELSKVGNKVTAIDISLDKIKNLQSGKTNVEGIDEDDLRVAISSGNFSATNTFSKIQESQVVFVCVPTPLGLNRTPDLTLLINACELVSNNLSRDTLVIIESTVGPGTTRNVVLPILEKGSGLNRGDFKVAFSPERIDPANKKWRINNTPKLVAGYTPEAADFAMRIYSSFISEIHICNSLEVAETAKLLENSFRFINISFINELLIFCEKLGIDVNDVINAAATKPYGFMPFYPSIGVGGHCIPVDPIYLANAAKAVGAPSRFIELADQINQEMPGYFVGRAEEKLGGLKNKRVLVVGVSYKPNVADVRESPVEALITGLKRKGAQVSWHDDLVKEWNGEKSVTISSDFDLAIIATPHDYIDLTKLGNVPILNTRGSI